MVQINNIIKIDGCIILALKDFITNNQISASLMEAFSNFQPPNNANDIKHFLIKNAVEFEKYNSRTFLVFDKINGKLKGYFTLTLKALNIKDISNRFKKRILKTFTSTEYLPAYLIAQVGRDINNSKKGFGKVLIETAITIINQVKKVVAGRIIYLDCKDELKTYYANLGFKLLQPNPKKPEELVQLYII